MDAGLKAVSPWVCILFLIPFYHGLTWPWHQNGDIGSGYVKRHGQKCWSCLLRTVSLGLSILPSFDEDVVDMDLLVKDDEVGIIALCDPAFAVIDLCEDSSVEGSHLDNLVKGK